MLIALERSSVVVVWSTSILTLFMALDAAAQGDRASAKLPALTLPDAQGNQIALAGYREPALVLVFAAVDCPLANLYLAEIVAMQERQGPSGVRFVAVFSNPSDDAKRVAEHAKERCADLSVLRDSNQRLANAMLAERTPEAMVFDRTRTLRYRGRIDDRYGYAHRRDVASRRDLECAIQEVLANKPVSVPRTEVAGCLIERPPTARKQTGATFAKEVSRIVQQKCESCHRPGMSAPFPLSSYDDVVRRAGPIREAVESGRMPPWHADPRHGEFANDRRLNGTERELLLAWLADGAPKGDERALPPRQTYAHGWRIGEPDLIFKMPKEVATPPTGIIPYKYFVQKTNFSDERWVRAAEIRPGNRAVLHHAIVFARPPGKTSLDPWELGQWFLAGEAPGDLPLDLAPGMARRIPAGAELVWQLHYTTNGKPQVDRSELGLIFHRGSDKPTVDVRALAIANQLLRIPPGAADYKHQALFTFHRPATILSFSPHMHTRGKDFLYTAIYPDGRRETLLSVPRYDFNWQTTYRLARPLELPAGAKIHCVAHFDNSPANLNNPDPKQTVTWGDQTTDEMMVGWLDYFETPPMGAQAANPSSAVR